MKNILQIVETPWKMSGSRNIGRKSLQCNFWIFGKSAHGTKRYRPHRQNGNNKNLNKKKSNRGRHIFGVMVISFNRVKSSKGEKKKNLISSTQNCVETKRRSKRKERKLSLKSSEATKVVPINAPTCPIRVPLALPRCK
ncbi:unnamed protein product [Caenorhabditis auriculariae]|uniref:Uncharacterized protein n=1 Tax=Caenorhabditis auriculariae TaxID=2777116 RepID=A0A8S1HW40_9PELO|nr:unnamed protein product [Caenorhabditis auriculariae]